jgi:hypothetical protein
VDLPIGKCEIKTKHPTEYGKTVTVATIETREYDPLREYEFDAQHFVSYAAPNYWDAETILATKYDIDALGTLTFFIGNDKIASFAHGHWQRVTLKDQES